ncbi:MAG: hypothetical protein AAB442_02950 [Patescibacteria group bacterium]
MSKLIKGCRAPFERAVSWTVFVFVMVLAGCGGGGSDIAAPGATSTAVEVAITPCEIVKEGGTCAADITVRNVSAADVVTVTCGGDAPPITGAMDASRKTKVDLEASKACIVAVNGRDKTTITVKAQCRPPLILGREGRCVSNTSPQPVVCQPGFAVGHFGTCVEAWWAAARIYAMGVKVVGANQLPPGCNTWAQQCWKEAVANGTVKFVATSAADHTGRPIIFAFFRNNTTMFGVTGLWETLPVYADDGTFAGSDIGGGVASEVDLIFGSLNGGVVHEVASDRCFEKYYFVNPQNGGTSWSVRPVTCSG